MIEETEQALDIFIFYDKLHKGYTKKIYDKEVRAVIQSMMPDEKLWHRQLDLQSESCREENKLDSGGPGPLCCWNICWWIG
ncbi:hypothetical protein IBX65_06695 [Candidatus Aerophobetes bacterium]|nr:hypothetical protein [Candidatus Aerophobetes bacterium]